MNKGSMIMILTKDDYVKEAERQRSNHAYYEKLNEHPTLGYALEIKKYVEFTFSRRQIDKKLRIS